MRVLVVEDDVDLGPSVAEGLRRAGFAIDLVTTLADADLALAVNPYDCVVCDRGLPDGDGLGVVELRRLRSPLVPVLMLTARRDIPARVEGFEAGVEDYLSKPFAMAELVVRVRALCRRGPVVPRQPTLVVGDLEVDLPRHRVHRAGVLLSLRAKEFAVLRVLAERPGEVVTRSELVDRCWDELHEPASNVVDVLVSQLRRRLGPPSPIETLRGVGYRLHG